jgi:hypothetical protein
MIRVWYGGFLGSLPWDERSSEREWTSVRMRTAAPIFDRTRALTTALVCALLLGVAGCASDTPGTGVSGGTPVPLPHFDHIVVVVEENHGYAQIAGANDAPYINALAAQGATFTNAHAVTHPSQPNYLALFAGSTFGLISDDCPQTLSAPDLGGEALARGLSFAGYSEGLPQVGYTGCEAGGGSPPRYARKHAPWVNFADVPAQSNRPFGDFPTDFSQLPTISFVIPDQYHDMHSGSIAAGDTWLREQMDPYAMWARTHSSLLIVTWDEDDFSGGNHILTFFVGAHVKPGAYAEKISHYDVLRTIEALAGLPFTRNAAHAMTIADVWQS